MGSFICQIALVLGAIFQTDCMEVATESVDKETLLLFDIDLVLMQPSDPAFQVPNIKRYHGRRYLKGLSKYQQEEFWNRVVLLPGSTLVEANTPCIIRRLENRQIAMAGLTHTLTRNGYDEAKLERLTKLGIVFQPICNEEMIFRELSDNRGSYPVYKGGVLFANTSPKGEVLVAFLKKLGWKPKKVVFIDDRQDNLIDVERALKEYDRSIDYTGYLYTAAYDYPSIEISKEEFDEKWEQLVESVKAD